MASGEKKKNWNIQYNEIFINTVFRQKHNYLYIYFICLFMCY